MSRKSDINLSLGIDISQIQKGFDEAVKSSHGAGKKLEGEAKKQTAIIQAQMDRIGKAKTLKQANRQMENLLGTMSQFGMEGSKAFGEVLKQAGALKDKEKDIMELVDMHSTALPWKSMAKAVKGAGQAVQMGTSAMALFGDESEETQKMMLKVQAAMSFAQSLDSIETLGDSFKALGIVIKANPIFFAAIAIAGIATAAYKLSEAFDDEAQSQKKAYEMHLKATESIQKEKVEIENLVAIAKNENVSRETRQKALDKLQSTYPSFLKNINLETIGTLNAKKALDALNDSLLNKAKAQIEQEELINTLREVNKLKKEVSDGKSVMGFFKFLGRTFESAEDALKEAKRMVKVHQANLKHYTIKGKIDFEEPKIPNAPKAPKASKAKILTEQEIADIDFDKALKEIDNYYSEVNNTTKSRLLEGQLTQKEFDAQNFRDKSSMLAEIISVYESYGKDVKSIESNLLDAQISYGKKLTSEKAKEAKIQAAEQKRLAKEKEKAEKEAAEMAAANAVQVNVEVGKLLEDTSSQMTTALATNLGQAIANNEDMGKAMGDTIMVGMADFLTNMGQLMITAGIAKLGFDTAMVQFGGAGAAIAAGFGLTLAGSTMKAAMSKDIAKPTALAEGGVMKNTTFGMLAEYNTSNNDPEVAIRSSYLRGMIADAVGNNGNGGNVKFRIEGRDLVGVLGRGLKDNSRA